MNNNLIKLQQENVDVLTENSKTICLFISVLKIQSQEDVGTVDVAINVPPDDENWCPPHAVQPYAFLSFNLSYSVITIPPAFVMLESFEIRTNFVSSTAKLKRK